MNNPFQRLLPFGRRAGAFAPDAVERKSAQPFFALHGLALAESPFGGAAAIPAAGFARNPVVYRCVRMISEAAASLDWLLYIGADEREDHPVARLLAAPNAQQDGHTFLEALYGHLLISGNAYIHALSLDGELRELHALRPDRVTPVADESGWPQAYDYRAGGRAQRLSAIGPRPPLRHLRLFNPLDEVCGVPPLQAARLALEIHNAAGAWNKSLLENSARPSGALVYSTAVGGHLTEAQFSRLKQELEDGYSGASRAGRPLVLEGGLDWKAMGYSPRDMDFVEARNGAARDIALAFGVPPMLLGIPGDNTYANYSEANRAFWRQTVLPLATRTASAFGGWLGAFYGGGLRLDFDRDRIEALSSDRDLLWRRLDAATFLTLDEKRQAAGYGPADPGDAAALVPPHVAQP
jgi:HK97 family phage portal protein